MNNRSTFFCNSCQK
ncbi:hypothetical protein OA107_00385 [Candidatus Pelagibacter sp.]|nr:hypothetical protein [Candidatus Pelagibacter sp.]